MKTLAILLVAFAALCTGREMLLAAAPDSATTEMRTYDILVDRAVVGQSTLAVARFADGREIATTDAKATVVWTVFKYVYEFHGQEQWYRGQLQQLNDRAIDGGKRLSLTASQTEQGWQVGKSGAQPTNVGSIHLTTNYWRQPAALTSGARLSVIDADSGKIYAVRCEQVGQEQIVIGSARVACNHFRFKGDIEANLWFDTAGYLVRWTGTEDGHATELRLAGTQLPTIALATTPR